MTEQRSPGEPTVQPIEESVKRDIKVTHENLDLALKILRQILDEEAQQ